MKDPRRDVQILKPSDWMNRDRNRRKSMDQDNDTLNRDRNRRKSMDQDNDTLNRDRNRRKSMDQDNDTLKEKGIAIVLSILFTGAGHLYAGKESRGAILLVIYFLLAILSVTSGGILLVALFPFWLWGIFDANRLVDEHNIRLRKATQAEQDKAKAEQDKAKAEQDKAKAEQEEVKKQTIASSDFVMRLEKISKLHSAKFLTEEEYLSQKKDLILSLLEKKPREDAVDFFSALIPSIEKGYLTETEISQIKKFVD